MDSIYKVSNMFGSVGPSLPLNQQQKSASPIASPVIEKEIKTQTKVKKRYAKKKEMPQNNQ